MIKCQIYFLNSFFLLFFVLLTLSSCQTYLKSINDKRIPPEAKNELNKLKGQEYLGEFGLQNSNNRIYTLANFLYKKNDKFVRARIIRTLVFENDSTIKIEYEISNLGKPLPGDLQSSNPVFLTSRMVEVTKKKVRYVCTHPTKQHSTTNFDEIQKITKEFNCPSWNTVFDDN